MTVREPEGLVSERELHQTTAATAPVSAPGPTLGLQSISVTVLAVLAVLYTLYFASPVLLPVALAIYLNLLLSPVMSLLTALRIPAPLAAAALVLGVIVVVVGTINLVAEPAQEWLDLSPKNLREMRDSLRAVKEPLNEIKDITEKVEDITEMATESEKTVATVSIEKPDLFLRMANQLPTSLTSVAIMIFLTFFLLASSGRFLNKMASAGRDFAEKRRIVSTLRQAQSDISRYLLTITIINCLLGTAVAACTFLLGFEDPWLWGVLAGLMNFIPYLGPLLTLVVLSFAGLVTFSNPQTAIIAPLFYLFTTILEGQVLTPMIIGERLSLSPVTVFMFLVFWGWIWGPVGMILAIPILLALRVAFKYLRGYTIASLLIAK